MLKQESHKNRFVFSLAIAWICFPSAIAAQNASTTQFRDVKPTDWAYPAIQSLVERYGCISGYPDSTFRGQQALTRYEFAAALNSCLDKLNASFTEQLNQKASKEELQLLQTDISKLNQELGSFADSVKHYYVIVPSTSPSLLEKAREIVPTAKLSSSRLGAYIEIQGFSKRSSAESLNSMVRSRGFDSRVIYAN
jgi:hypothetical protein